MTKVGADAYIVASGATAEDLNALPRVGVHKDAMNLPVILLGERRLSEKTIDALEALKAVNICQPRIFQQGGVLVRLRLDGEAPRVEPLIPDAMRGELDRAALWKKTTDKGTRVADPPMSIVRDILSLPSYDGFPHLRAVAEAPFFTSEGGLVRTPGYHKDAGTFLRLPPTLKVPHVPAAPSTDDVRRAAALFEQELLVNFPFVDAASRAHAIGLVLLPFVREMISGPTPTHALDSPMPGTGKGLVADLVALIATGRPIEVMSEAKDNEELRKRITAVLLSGTPFGLFDNITRRLESAVLSAALTASTWSDRVLGLSKMVRLPIRIAWIVTGNNLTFSREMARRSVQIRLDAKSPEPHLRGGFKHDPIHEWVLEHRGELVWAALVMVQHWIAQGRRPFTKTRMGSYEAWTEVVGGILSATSIQGFLENLSTFAARADAESAEWRRFVTAWWERCGGKDVDTGAIFPLAETALPEVLGDGTERAQRTRLGQALAKRVGWTFAISPASGGEKLALRLDEAEADVVDAEGRKRKGWSLKRTEGGSDVGTLGETLGTPQVADLFDAPNVGPNVPTLTPLGPEENLEEMDL